MKTAIELQLTKIAAAILFVQNQIQLRWSLPLPSQKTSECKYARRFSVPNALKLCKIFDVILAAWT